MQMAHWRDFDDKWPDKESEEVFRRANGSRVGQTGSEWNERKRWFLLAWKHLAPYRDELLKIAAQVGEPKDPFAAWEKLSPSPVTQNHSK